MNDRNVIIDQRPSTIDPIHVALAVYDPSGTYSQHAGVTITSTFENTKSNVIIHLLHDDTLTEDNRKKFVRTAEKYNQTIELHDITEYAKKLDDKIITLSGNFTVGTLFRLFIPSIMPSLKKIIYLDCDVLVNLDINELWSIDTEDNAIIGVHDHGTYYDSPKSFYNTAAKLALGDCRLYINAGVLVMNLQKIRTYENFLDVSINWIINNSHIAFFTDQDAINVVFKNDIKYIDERFNMTDPKYDDISNCIVHMYKISKPWEEFTNAPHHVLYWDMYLRSAWGENVTPHELIEKLSIISGTMKHSSKQCLRRVVAAIWKRITFREKRKIIKLILTDIFHKIKYKLLR